MVHVGSETPIWTDSSTFMNIHEQSTVVPTTIYIFRTVHIQPFT